MRIDKCLAEPHPADVRDRKAIGDVDMSQSDALPKSLTGHVVPAERLDVIRPHVTRLSETALAVSDRLALGCDCGDVFAVMARDANQRDEKRS